MPLNEDISWQVLRRIVQEWAGTSAELAEVKPLHGGCINTTLHLILSDGAQAVAKVSQHRVDRSYQREAYQLNLMRELGLPVPQIYVCKVGTLDDPHSYLLMEFMQGVDLAAAKKQCSQQQFEELQMHLAELVLQLHCNVAHSYRRVTGEDGAREFDSWIDFYRHIYDPIWHECEKAHSLPVKIRKQIGKVHERLERLIGHNDVPRLVHWDIWSTNVMCARDEHGRWRVTALLDPNCKYAHAEAELAYLDLFHTSTPAFMRAYQQAHRLPDEYHKVRKLVYQVYPLINHVQLFGPEYLKHLTSAVAKTTAIV
ncbi:MAG TPA: fructosamine kinase family protein [Tepidisphaeraceae bacterium]|jgi:fructosamine-3-kinase|nr:fructosamine kinase family protein [Tepidisphaeraceae bacterium]